ncbi:hypothetical protein [Vulcanisaeta distributa]|uniref:hypothetical protein n=1 Tax=Vulcanisaeta distributa TaxID=164451 RepID=UPI001FB2069C|nr:hypothetical protein [Vulcanisaeta distributa]
MRLTHWLSTWGGLGGGDEGVLKVQFRLMGFNEDVLTELVRAGVLMHRRRGVYSSCLST